MQCGVVQVAGQSPSPSSTEVATPSSAAPISKAEAALCDPSKYTEYLSVRKNAESPSNEELIEEAAQECKAALRELSQQMFGPPRFWEIFNVACKNQCDAWDGLVSGGLAQSRCSHKELGIEDQSTAFWQCKILYDCYENADGERDPLAHRENFCNGCGTSQTNEVEFYEELDCGAGMLAGRALWGTALAGMATFMLVVPLMF